MFTEQLHTLQEWLHSDVVIVADTINGKGSKDIVSYHGQLLKAQHEPFDKNALFSVDAFCLRTSDMHNSYLSIPTEYILGIEFFPTEVKITKTNGFTVTITRNQK